MVVIFDVFWLYEEVFSHKSVISEHLIGAVDSCHDLRRFVAIVGVIVRYEVNIVASMYESVHNM